MKTLAIALTLVAATAAASLDNAKIVPATLQALPENGWVAYELPSNRHFTMCCFQWSEKHLGGPASCRLGDGNVSMGDFEGARKIDTSTMIVAMRREAGAVADVEVYSGGCPVDARSATVHVLSGVTTDQSLDLLERAGDRKAAMRAIAMHDSPRVPPLLERYASDRQRDDDERGEALFWLAQVGGRRGFEFVRRAANDDPESEIRNKAVFALTQSSDPGVFDALVQIATKHADDETRSEAVFWLGQHENQKALPILRDRIANDSSGEVREKAIFAIAQVPGEEAAQLLVKLARGDRDPEVRKQSLFWLGQVADRKLSVLREAADRDPDSDVREMAVFAISQRPADEAIPQLIRLANTHRDIAVRKKAVFWLSQIDDPRAIDAIEKIVLH